MFHKGWDIFQTEPGKHESMICAVCNKKMSVKRNVEGPTSWAGAISQITHLHDSFTCKNSNKKWHMQVLKLRQAIIATPSAKLSAIYLEEINEILASKKETKEVIL